MKLNESQVQLRGPPLHLNKVYRVRASGFVPPVNRGGQEDGGLLLGGG